MGFYGDHVLPRIIDVGCGLKAVRPLRRRVCAGLAGEVLEVGFGSGLNVPFYPGAVTRGGAAEPGDAGWRPAQRRLRQSPVPAGRAGLDGPWLPFPDDGFDTALSTWTMCTIPGVATAPSEVRRVLKRGGA